KENADVDLTEEGGKAPSTFAQGFMNQAPSVDEEIGGWQQATEQKFNETDASQGGRNTANTYRQGFLETSSQEEQATKDTRSAIERNLSATNKTQHGIKAGQRILIR